MKKAQAEFSILTFIVIVAALLIISPIMLKVYRSAMVPLGNALAPMSPTANDTVTTLYTTVTNFWDWVIIMAFLVQIILLFISAFLVNTHPIFLVMYIIFSIFAVIFIPGIQSVMDKVYENYETNTTLRDADLEHLTFSVNLRENFPIIMIFLIFITGVIAFGKMRGGSTIT